MIAFRKRCWDQYKELIGECSNLDCKHYTQLEAHHIIPIAAGGLDEFDNIIVLCKTCHMNSNYHSDWVLHQDELHKWKGEVDSHLIYDDLHERWISVARDVEYENTIIEKNKEISWDKIKPWSDRGFKAMCYGCAKQKSTYRFGSGFFCMDCILKYIESIDNSIREKLLLKVPKAIKLAYNRSHNIRNR